MKVWATFKEGSRLYGRHFSQLFVLNAVTFLPAAIIAFAVSREAMPIGNSQEAIDRWATLTAALVGAMMLWSLVSTATLHYAVGDAYQTGQCRWRDSLTRCRPRLVMLAKALGAIAVLVAAATVLGIVVATLSEVAGLVLLVAAALVGSVFGTTFLTILVPVIVREDVGVRESLTRTWALIRGHLLVLIALMFVSGFIIGICNQMLSGMIQGGFTATATTQTPMLLAVFASIVVPTLVFTPWWVAVVTIAYIRLREDRGESIDGATPTPGPQVPRAPAADTLTTAHDLLARPSGSSVAPTGQTLDDAVLALLHMEPAASGGEGEPAPHAQTPATAMALDNEVLALLQLDPPSEPDAQTTSPAGQSQVAETGMAADDDVIALLELDAPPHAPVRARPRWSEPLGNA